MQCACCSAALPKYARMDNQVHCKVTVLTCELTRAARCRSARTRADLASVESSAKTLTVVRPCP